MNPGSGKEVQSVNKETTGVQRSIHPGAGRRKAIAFPKGRQGDPAAAVEIKKLLGDRPRQKDLLIEYLHLIQDRFGCLKADHLQALAGEMNLPLAAVYEVATFYAHFDVVLDGEAEPEPITIRVCDSISCALAGGEKLLAEAGAAMSENVRVVRAPCMGRCANAPVAEVGHRHVDHATIESLSQVVETGDLSPEMPAFIGLDAYIEKGGYALLKACRAGEHSADDLVATLSDSGLRGLGGAGFPVGLKWKIVRQQTKPRLLAVNGDEGEPGTFKDRHYLESDPHRFLEGMLIAAWACELETCYIYIRDEYPAVLKILRKELEALEEKGLLGDLKIDLRRGAGAYICGEESAMLESIEGKRGLPRHKPPFPSEIGLFGLPTLTHNVETLHWVRDIVEKGAEWFSGEGLNGRKGLRSFSVSGRVKDPGVKLAPAGLTLAQLVEDYCGGMLEGHELKGYLPGGASGGILPAGMADQPLDFGTLEQFGCFIGSAAVVVLSDQDDVVEVVKNLLRFFEDESCGQCTPCRVGTEKAMKLLDQDKWDLDLLKELSAAMMDSSICGLGQAAPNPLLSLIKYFPEELR
jgi:formate dehydrogenase